MFGSTRRTTSQVYVERGTRSGRIEIMIQSRRDSICSICAIITVSRSSYLEVTQVL
jgi:hypothetical protein